MTRATYAAAFVIVAVSFGLGQIAQAQAPIRIGVSIGQTGSMATLGTIQLRGYQMCVKHTNEKGGLLGRKLELVVYDDASAPSTAAVLYEKLITQDRVDLILGPNTSLVTEAVANVTEKHKMPMVASVAPTSSIYKKGRKYVFGVFSPAEVYLEGLIDLAAKRGLKTVALIHPDELFARAVAQGTVELAKKKGLQVVFVEAYLQGTTDFSAILTKVRTANPDVLAGPTRVPDDAVAIIRQMQAMNVNPRMVGLTTGVDLPRFYEALGRDAEFVYGATQWLPELVELRAGGLIPIARQYPGAREFVEALKKEFPATDLHYNAAAGYGGCQILIEAVRRADSLDREKIRASLLKMDYSTVFGGYRVDGNGLQIAHKSLMFQWQDGKKAIVWPEELAADRPRFPTPEWSKRP